MKHLIYKIPHKSSPCLYPLQHELIHASNLKCFYTVLLSRLLFEIIMLSLLYIANMARSSIIGRRQVHDQLATIIKCFHGKLKHFRRKLDVEKEADLSGRLQRLSNQMQNICNIVNQTTPMLLLSLMQSSWSLITCRSIFIGVVKGAVQHSVYR